MAEMKINFIGVARRFGKSAKNGNSYDICELFHAWPLTAKTTEHYTYTVHGFEQRSMKLSPDAVKEFASVSLGDEVTVILDADPENPMRNICTGLA